jgi:hypothetical protein
VTEARRVVEEFKTFTVQKTETSRRHDVSDFPFGLTLAMLGETAKSGESREGRFKRTGAHSSLADARQLQVGDYWNFEEIVR